MLQRHEILPSGRKADRDWWFATKVWAMVVGALIAAYVVHIAVL